VKPALPDARQLTRRIAVGLAVVGVAAFVVAKAPGLSGVRHQLGHASPWWLALAVVLEVASTLSFAAAFRGAIDRRGSRRSSIDFAMTAQGINVLLPAGGTSGLAVVALVMTRAGVPRAFAVARTVAVFLLTSAATFVAIAFAGIAVATGLLPADIPRGAALVPAAGALLVVFVVAALPRIGMGEASGGGRIRRALHEARAHSIGGVEAALTLVRRRDALAIGGSIGYLAFDIAALTASFEALGGGALPVGALVLAYTLGHAGAIIPFPGSAESGLLGMFVLFGASLPVAAAAILLYRAVALGVPALSGLAGMADLRRQLRRAPSPEVVAQRYLVGGTTSF
jgi:uncharacterized membrane protein YbhN (UPF0104 family)